MLGIGEVWDVEQSEVDWKGNKIRSVKKIINLTIFCMVKKKKSLCGDFWNLALGS